MPIYKDLIEGIREKHTAYRLQVELTDCEEDVLKMKPLVFFTVQTETVDGVPLSAPINQATPLTLDPSTDAELAQAIALIQNKIGLARHAQLHAPPPAPVDEPSLFVSPVQG